MERLTMIDEIGNDELVRCMGCGLEKAGENLENCGFCEEGWQKALKKLAAYEDTGLDPEDLKKTFNEELLLTMTAQMMGITPERLGELAKADRDGRCLVLPCKVGDTVYVVGKIKVVEAVISEIYTLDGQKGVEYLVNFNCDENCKGCPFYAWEQSWEGEWSCDCGYGEGAIFQKDFGKTVFLTRDAAADALKGEQHGE